MGRDTDLILLKEDIYLGQVAPLLSQMFFDSKIAKPIIDSLVAVDYWDDLEPDIQVFLDTPEKLPWVERNIFSSKVDTIDVDKLINGFVRDGYITLNNILDYRMSHEYLTKSQRTLLSVAEIVIPYYCWDDDFSYTYPFENTVWYSRRDANILSNFLRFCVDSNREPDLDVVDALLKLCYRWVGVSSINLDSDAGGPYGWLSNDEVSLLAEKMANYGFLLMNSIKIIESPSSVQSFIDKNYDFNITEDFNEFKLSKLYSMCVIARDKGMGLAFYLSG